MNSIFVIHPYLHERIWVFDDASVGLRQEPFVSGSDTILDQMVLAIPNAEAGFTLLFSSRPFPGYQIEIEWRRGEMAGNWYYCAALDLEGWLCPAMLKYFTAPPRRIYAQFRAKTASARSSEEPPAASLG